MIIIFKKSNVLYHVFMRQIIFFNHTKGVGFVEKYCITTLIYEAND